MFDCMKELSWMRKFFWEMAIKEPCPIEEKRFEATKVSSDRKAAFSIAVNKLASARMKPIPLQFHFAKNCIECGEVGLLNVPCNENIANMMSEILDLPTMKH